MDPFKYLAALIQRSSDDAPQKGPHVTRFQMYRNLKGKLAEHDSPEKTGVTISGSQPMARTVGLLNAKMQDVAFPTYDITKLPFEPESLDFIISDQVLEHVRGDIPKLFRDLAGMLKPGGYMVHATVFITEIHPTPTDCWRFTPDGLRWLAEQAGMDNIEVDGWGNRAVWLYIMLGQRFTPIPDDETHPSYKLATFNEAHHPIVVWVICRKPLKPEAP